MAQIWQRLVEWETKIMFAIFFTVIQFLVLPRAFWIRNLIFSEIDISDPKNVMGVIFLFGNYRKCLYSMLRIISGSLADRFCRLQTNRFFRPVCGQFLIQSENIRNLYDALTQRPGGVWWKFWTF